MKHSLFIVAMIFTLTTAIASETAIEQDSIPQQTEELEIVGQTVRAWYTHGGDLAKVNSVHFQFTNHTNKEVVINLRDLNLVHTDREGIEQSKNLIVNGTEVTNADLIKRSTFNVPANAVIDVDITFRSIDIGIFYYNSYRAIRLHLDVDGVPTTSDAELDVMREDDYDYKELQDD